MSKNIYFVDCFDTIVYRKFSPNDVIFLWAKKVGEKYKVSPTELFRLFMCAEQYSSNFNLMVKGSKEFTIDDVVSFVAKELKKQGALIDVAEVIKVYYETEKENLLANDTVFNFLKDRKKEGSKIYLVSNFYVKAKELKTWLEKVGVLSLFDDVFVSCDYGCSKGTTLYPLLLEKLNIEANQVTMIGDNKVVDCKCSAKYGISSIHIKARSPRDKITKKMKYRLPVPKELKEIYNSEKSYSNYAFPLYSAMKRLHAYVDYFGIKNLFFLSREGQFLKRLYDKYQEINNLSTKTHYLGISRNTIFLASAQEIENQDFSYLSRFKMSLRDLMASLQFTKSEIESVTQNNLSLDFDCKKDNIIGSEFFDILKKDKNFVEIYDNKRKKFKIFDEYIKSFGVNFTKEGLNIVDVGWTGSMQNNLNNYFIGGGSFVKVKGFYLGIRHNIIPHKDNKYPLMLVANRPNMNLNHNKIYQYKCLDYEQILRADHNRIAGYKKLEDNSFDYIYDNSSKDNLIFKKYVSKLQDDILDKFAKICVFDRSHVSPIYSICEYFFCKTMGDAREYDHRIIKNCHNNNYEGFGIVGYSYAVKHYQNYLHFRLSNMLFSLKGAQFKRKRTKWL